MPTTGTITTTTRATDRRAFRLRPGTLVDVRCVCGTCGIHVTGTLSRSNLVGFCANCGGYDVRLA